ncbi:DNA mismatch repair protein (Mlh3) [Aspergillus bombycis]|uniref:DNA mismatch repair protein (Mlh3) n=1 Tax=Aspergillus bombycis TaxID=109264 RepID=A0A1F7ZY49_9EURO|nr:DNA mismatch repair protein (Mlh3) [Aspergillus bombycis]OGM44394.1 DNA mismatch repair protein (Mlh3) [Aspergillus bombycis]
MSGNSRRIEPLPPEVVAKLKSSTSITHLNGVIVELVKNALDADARTVSVTVDFRRGGCKVDDDGDGILPTEFEPSGGLGKAHHTSKYQTLTGVYGQKGLFLASLSSLSLLTITSHHVRHPNTNTIMFHHSTPVARLIPAPVQQELRLSSHGTSVTVNDLFGNMPVRVKHRALALQRHDELDRQWDELRQQLVSLMLANSNLTKLVIIEASRDKRISIRTQNRRTDRELDLQRIVSILAQAGLIEPQNAHSWDAVSANVPSFSVHAAISLVPNPTKKIQFISLGMDPVFPKSSVNIFYAEVNRLFSLSDFGTTGTPSTFAPRRSPAKPPGRYSGSSTKSMTKAVNKWPMFYIRIDTNETHKINSEGHELPESDKSVQRIMDVLAAMIQEFLKQHDLRPRAGRRQRVAQKQTVGTPTSSSDRAPNRPGQAFNSEEALYRQLKLPNFQMFAPNVSQSFGEWSRIKSAHESFNARSTRPKAKSTSPEKACIIKRNLARETLPTRPERNKRRMLEGSDALATYTGFTTPETENGSGSDIVVHWTDSYTGRRHLINSRTGQSVGTRSPLDAVQRPRSTGSLQTIRECDSITRPKSAILSKTQNLWVEKMMDNWENPVFSRSEKFLDVVGTGYGTKAHMAHSRVNDVPADVCGFENLGLPNVRGKLRRQDLETAEIIAQVDHKFVLAKIRSMAASEFSNDPGSILVLIDQHAADERCRVERLFKEYFTPSLESSGQVRTITLEPIIFEIPVTEAYIFGRYKQFFESWGVEYTVEQGPADKSVYIYVHTLPMLIAERCRLEPELVTNLIRGHIWKREGNGMGPEDRVTVLGQDRWAEQLDICPQGIVELLNSRACRTAIMFNDDLTIEECQSLVQNLARCIFPFQCAHGRPSMIPLLDMTDTLAMVHPEAEYMSEEEEQAEFPEVFKAWRDKITFH